MGWREITGVHPTMLRVNYVDAKVKKRRREEKRRHTYLDTKSDADADGGPFLLNCLFLFFVGRLFAKKMKNKRLEMNYFPPFPFI